MPLVNSPGSSDASQTCNSEEVSLQKTAAFGTWAVKHAICSLRLPDASWIPAHLARSCRRGVWLWGQFPDRTIVGGAGII